MVHMIIFAITLFGGGGEGKGGEGEGGEGEEGNNC